MEIQIDENGSLEILVCCSDTGVLRKVNRSDLTNRILRSKLAIILSVISTGGRELLTTGTLDIVNYLTLHKSRM